MAQDLERSRFEFALERVGELRQRGGPQDAKALEKLPGLPVLVRTHGLLVAYAMLRDGDGGALAGAMEAWLTRRAPKPPLKVEQAEVEFMLRCTQVSRSAYLAAQWEAVQFARALKLVGAALGAPAGN
jgi:hypothetical protein